MKDYTGFRLNMLTGSRFDKRVKNKTYWFFRCDCGNEKSLSISGIQAGSPNSCGCSRKSIKRYSEDIDTSYISFNLLVRVYKKGARQRGVQYLITDSFVKYITNENCHYCGIPPHKKIVCGKNTPYLYNGIDRKDNEIGYVEYNCVPCCEICNKSKRHLKYDVFLDWIKRVSEFKCNK